VKLSKLIFLNPYFFKKNALLARIFFGRIQDGLNSSQLNILLDKENGLYILYLH
jgi:hypothetical protein